MAFARRLDAGFDIVEAALESIRIGDLESQGIGVMGAFGPRAVLVACAQERPDQNSFIFAVKCWSLVEEGSCMYGKERSAPG